MGSRKDFLENAIVKYCQKLDQKGFVANHDGNITCKFENYLLATPTAEAKAEIRKDMILLLSQDGEKIEGLGKPFSEIKLHLAAYSVREEARAVIHAHPPFLTARGLAGQALKINIPEAIVSIGDEIPCTEFSMPGSDKNIDELDRALSKADVFMMAGNGAFAIGDNLEQAYLRLELAEHVCKIDYYTRQFGTSYELEGDNLQKLLDKRASIGLGPKKLTKTKKAESKQEENSELRELIKREILKALESN